MPSILISDDHAVVRHGIRQTLAEEIEGGDFCEAADSASTIAQLRERPFDLLILDLSMPGKSGLEILREAREICPRLPILVFSIHSESLYAIRVLKAGASGYICKDAPREELVRAVRRVLGGGKYVSESLAEQLASELAEPPETLPHTTLSDREYEVLLALASGKSISHLAAELAVSIKTISTYRRRILEKMRLDSNAALVRYCLEHKLL